MISCYGSKLASVATDCFTARSIKKIICQNIVKKYKIIVRTVAKYDIKTLSL